MNKKFTNLIFPSPSLTLLGTFSFYIQCFLDVGSLSIKLTPDAQPRYLVGRGPDSASSLCTDHTCAPTTRVHSSDKSQQNNLLSQLFSPGLECFTVLPPPPLLGWSGCKNYGVIVWDCLSEGSREDRVGNKGRWEPWWWTSSSSPGWWLSQQPRGAP